MHQTQHGSTINYLQRLQSNEVWVLVYVGKRHFQFYYSVQILAVMTWSTRHLQRQDNVCIVYVEHSRLGCRLLTKRSHVRNPPVTVIAVVSLSRTLHISRLGVEQVWVLQFPRCWRTPLHSQSHTNLHHLGYPTSRADIETWISR